MAARNEPPSLEHLGGAEIERVARSMASANLRTLIENKDAIVGLKADEIQRLADLAAAAGGGCGGFGCG
jgi:hypothetical protein